MSSLERVTIRSLSIPPSSAPTPARSRWRTRHRARSQAAPDSVGWESGFFRWALLSIVAAAILVQPRRSSTSSCAVSAAHLERRSKALWSIWHLPGGGCPTPVGCCRGWGRLLPTHIPSVMQPFVASMEVVGVPLGSGQPMVLRVASWWLATGLHRSGGVPTDGQQVSIPLCRFVSLWGAVCLLTL